MKVSTLHSMAERGLATRPNPWTCRATLLERLERQYAVATFDKAIYASCKALPTPYSQQRYAHACYRAQLLRKLHQRLAATPLEAD